MIPEVRTSTNDPLNPSIEVHIGSTVYKIGPESAYFGGRGHGDLIQVACNNLKIFHERRYVKPPYKIPFKRPMP